MVEFNNCLRCGNCNEGICAFQEKLENENEMNKVYDAMFNIDIDDINDFADNGDEIYAVW